MPSDLAIAQPGVRAAVDAASRGYLRGESLDMTALAADLGVGRATLYRWVGSREQLLSMVLAEATRHSFEHAHRLGRGHGVDFVVDVCERFMRSVLAADALQVFTRREPALYLRLATGPGAIEHAAADAIADMLDAEAAAGRLRLHAPAAVLAGAIVRVCDTHTYAHLLGRTEPDVDTAVLLIRLLLRD